MRMLREEYGVFVSGVTYPVVPQGIFLFRLIPTASHTDEDVDLTLKVFKAMRDKSFSPISSLLHLLNLQFKLVC